MGIEHYSLKSFIYDLHVKILIRLVNSPQVQCCYYANVSLRISKGENPLKTVYYSYCYVFSVLVGVFVGFFCYLKTNPQVPVFKR